MPATTTMFCQTPTTIDGKRHSLSPGGGMILPSTNQEEIVKGFLSELTFWGDLPMAAESQHDNRDELTRIKVQRDTISDSCESRRSQTLKEVSKSPMNTGSVWRTAVDPHSGRTYYYDAISRRTQWDKPDEIRQLERQRRQEKRAADKAFFVEMERNIMASLESGELIPGISHDSPHIIATPSRDEQDTECCDDVCKPARIRTISAMDQVMIEALKEEPTTKVSPVLPASRPLRDAHGRPPLPSGRARLPAFPSHGSSISLELSPEESGYEKYQMPQSSCEETTETLRGEALLDSLLDDGPLEQDIKLEAAPYASKSMQNHVRRNTGGTIFVKSTMMNPNIEATIKCVCGVYRTHIINFAAQRSNRSPISIMGHVESRDEISVIYQDLPTGDTEVPSQADVILFYKDFYQRSQMEHDTIIMSLIYVERLIKATSGVIAPVPENWKSILFSCMVLASKVWDDLSMWNVDFSNVCSRDRTQLCTFTLGRINQLELALLKSLNFNVKVPASEYAKYYFLIRGMLMKSGLLNEQNKFGSKGAKNLEKWTADHQEVAKTSIPQSNVHRISQSMGDYKWLNPNDDDSGPIHSSVCLESLLVSLKG